MKYDLQGNATSTSGGSTPEISEYVEITEDNLATLKSTLSAVGLTNNSSYWTVQKATSSGITLTGYSSLGFDPYASTYSSVIELRSVSTSTWNEASLHTKDNYAITHDYAYLGGGHHKAIGLYLKCGDDFYKYHYLASGTYTTSTAYTSNAENISLEKL